MGVENEYESLRQEALNWQQNRIKLVSLSIVLITATLGLVSKLGQDFPCPREILSSILLAFIICVCLLTWYYGKSTARLGTYIEVFHEKKSDEYHWHIRNSKFLEKRKMPKILSLNACLALIYLVLGLASVFIPLGFDFNLQYYEIFYSLVAIYIVVLILLFGFSYSRKTYKAVWEGIRLDEEKERGNVCRT